MSERPTTKHDIQRDELNTIRPNFAEVTRVFVTGSIGMTYSGVDIGTGDVTLFVTGSAGGRELLPANRTYYVRTDGSDSNTGLVDSAGGAFLTAGKANTVVATIDKNGYDIAVQFGTGTWNESITINAGIGDGIVTWKGTLTSLEAVTSATVAAGSGTTAGTVTKTGQFTGNNYTGKLCYFETDAEYRVIYSNDNNALTLADLAPSSTTQNVTIYDWGTNLSNVEIVTTGIVLEKIHFNNGQSVNYSVFLYPMSSAILLHCSVKEGAVLAMFVNQAQLEFAYDCYFYTNSAIGLIQAAYSGTAVLQRCFMDGNHTSTTCVTVSRGGYILLFGGTIDGNDGIGGKATYGFRGWGGASGQSSNTTGIGTPKIKNCDTGVRAEWTTSLINFSSIGFTTCTTNTSADAATYSVIT